jgi:hypothetical protein
MKLRLLERLRSRRRPTDWVEDLTPEQRRLLAQNLRELVESKRSIERRITAASPRA